MQSKVRLLVLSLLFLLASVLLRSSVAGALDDTDSAESIQTMQASVAEDWRSVPDEEWVDFPNELTGTPQLTESYYRVKSGTPWDSNLQVPANHSVVVDLNGSTIYKGSGQGKPLFELKSGSTLTIVNSKSDTQGRVDGSDADQRSINVMGPNATLNLEEGVTLTASMGGSIYATGNSVVNVNGARIDGNNQNGKSIVQYESSIYLDSATLNINEGSLLTTSNGGAVYAHQKSTVNLYGGSVRGNFNSHDGGHGGGLRIEGASTLNMYDGATVSGNQASGNGGGISLGAAGSGSNVFNFYGGQVSDNQTGQGGHGGGIYLAGASSMTIAEESTALISGNTARWGGGVSVGSYMVYWDSITKGQTCTGEVQILGGTISDNKADDTGSHSWTGTGGGGINIAFSNPASKDSIEIGGNVQITGNTGKDYGGGVVVYASTVELTGGTITKNYTTLSRADVQKGGVATHYGGAGLFVFLQDTPVAGSEFTMSGGLVSENVSAAGGGGIYVDGVEVRSTDGKNKPNKSLDAYGIFTITGGTIKDNIAQSAEGGGIRIRWARAHLFPAKDTLIQIERNKTLTAEDWGGGGIFCEEGGYLNITDALITKNTAEGFGGGVAGCSTGDDGLTFEQSAAIFGNDAKGDATAGVTSLKQKDHQLVDAKKITQGDGQDYFSANISDVVGMMLGGGDPKWNGKYGVVEEDGTVSDHTIERLPYGDFLEATDYIVLNSNPSESDINLAKRKARVIITENTSNVHGGGILNNGVMFIGAENSNCIFAPQIRKEITGDDGRPESTFTFTLQEGTYEDGVFTPKEGGHTDEVTIDSSLPDGGLVRFEPIVYTYGEEPPKIADSAKLQYLISEKAGNDEYTYDTNRWLLTVNIVAVIDSTLADIQVQNRILKIDSFSYQMLDAEGNEVGEAISSLDAQASFVNDYTKIVNAVFGPVVNKRIITNDGDEIDNWDFEGKPFSFTLSSTDDYAPLPDERTVETDSVGKASWDEVNLEPNKVYHYTIEEVRGENADVEYDTKSHTLTVTVDDDGEVTQKWDGHPSSDDAQVIENIYSPKTTLALSLQKEYLEKETNEKLDISQGQFSFTLSPADSNLDAPMPTNPVAETDGDGKVKWEDITYEDIGEWDYIVTENDPKDPSVIWDETEHKVHVSVIRNLDHTLSASWTWDGAAASPTVSNQHYSPVHLPLTGSTGITATFQAGAALCAIGITGALLSKRKPEKVKPYKPKHLDKK